LVSYQQLATLVEDLHRGGSSQDETVCTPQGIRLLGAQAQQSHHQTEDPFQQEASLSASLDVLLGVVA
jgi:hypothetical protein